METEQKEKVTQFKFSRALAKKTKQETIETHGEAVSQSIEVASPGKKDFCRARGNSLDDLIWAHTCIITDPDGEPNEYIIQCRDETIRKKVFEILDNKVNLKILAPMINSFEEEFIWAVNQNATGKNKAWQISGKKALMQSQKEWVRITWKGMNRGYVCTRPLSPERYGEPKFTNIDDETLVNIAFDGRVITNLEHEALKRHQGA